MRVSVHRLLMVTLCAASTLTAVDAAQAQTQTQTYPNRPIRMVVPFPAGGPTDGMARIISDRLGTVLGQTVVIENRGGGAGGSVGAKVVAAADPDGYTILITPGGSLTNGPAVHRNIGYDPVKAFSPVALLMTAPLIVTVHPSLPVRTVAELVAYSKANPGKVIWGSQGFGTGPHLLCEMMNFDTGAKFQHVPYRGSAPAITALLAGEIQTFTDASTTIFPHIQSGKARPIAVTTATRVASLPDIPTVAEAGFPRMQRYFWLGVVAPGGTPPAIIDKLNAALRESMAPAETRQRLANLGADVAIGTPEEFRKMLADELAFWTVVAKSANIQVD
jgi:tripartite-type tricarboxylate transporter receptor subunit TctC